MKGQVASFNSGYDLSTPVGFKIQQIFRIIITTIVIIVVEYLTTSYDINNN